MFGKKTRVKDVINAWDKFILIYRKFRDSSGMSAPDYSAFEICTSLSDKHGRICRQIKHAERNDAKSDWPQGMTEAMAGYIVYLEMLLDKYKISASDGWRNELESALRQYRVKTDIDCGGVDEFECEVVVDGK